MNFLKFLFVRHYEMLAFLVLSIQTWCLFYTYSTSQLGIATFQELSNPLWLVATMLGDTSPSL